MKTILEPRPQALQRFKLSAGHAKAISLLRSYVSHCTYVVFFRNSLFFSPLYFAVPARVCFEVVVFFRFSRIHSIFTFKLENFILFNLRRAI